MRPARFAPALVFAAVVASLAVAVLSTWRTPDLYIASGYVQTSTGPLGPVDRDALARVKQAGLWEMPAGAELATRGSAPKVREIGRKISAEHHELDEITDEAARELGVTLPRQATVVQQDWLAEIRAAGPSDVDSLGVNLLRQAHGIVLPLLAQVRVNTRNATMRTFLDTSMAFVARHIGYLESTGLVDYALLPEPPPPVPRVPPVKAGYYYLANRPTLTVAVLVMLGLATTGFLVARRLTRRHRSRSARHRRR